MGMCVHEGVTHQSVKAADGPGGGSETAQVTETLSWDSSDVSVMRTAGRNARRVDWTGNVGKLAPVLMCFISLTAHWCLCGEQRGRRYSLHFFVPCGCEILICCLFKNGFEGQVEALVVKQQGQNGEQETLSGK